MNRLIIFILFAGIGLGMWVNSAESANQIGGGGTIGIKGQDACNYSDIGDAIADAIHGDTIFVQPGSYNQRLGEIDKDLTLLPTPAGSNCTDELIPAFSSTVQFLGENGLHVSEGGNGRVSNGATVLIRHMQIRNANSTADNGGIFAVVEGSKLILDDVNVFDGTALDNGGGIYASCQDDCTVQMLNGSNVFRNNATNNGGGIYLNRATLSVTGSSIGLTENPTYFNEAINGGGIYANASEVTLEDGSAVQRNEANGDGAGLWIDRTDLVIRDSTLFDNKAIGGDGGGLWIQVRDAGDEPTLSNVTIQENVALNNGGGIYQATNFTGSDVDFTMLNGELRGNTAANGDGGGAYLYVSSQRMAAFEDVMIVENTANVDGGGIYMGLNGSPVGTLLIRDGGVFTNTATTGAGGGVHTYNGTLSIVSSEVNGNLANTEGGGAYASFGTFRCSLTPFNSNSFVNFGAENSSGGGVFLSDTNEARLFGCDFDNNSAVESGGALAADFVSELTITHSTYSRNRVETPDNRAGGGGAISANRILDFMTLSNLTLRSNTARKQGGAIEIEGSDSVLLRNSDIRSNRGDRSGGGLWCRDSELTVENSTFEFNSTLQSTFSQSGGGGMYLENGCETIVRGSTFESNDSAEFGGAMFAEVDGSIGTFETLLIEDTTFDNNEAMGGGAIYLFGRATSPGNTAMIKNSEFINNDANEVEGESNDGRGGGIYADRVRLRLENVSLRDNSAAFSGGAIFSDGTTLHTSSNATTCNSATLPTNRYCSEMIGNYTTEPASSGGAIYILGSGSSATSNNQSIFGLGNTALISNEAENGAAIYVKRRSFHSIQSTLLMTNSLVVTNQHPSFSVSGTHMASAIELHDDTVMIARHNTIANNFGKPLEVQDAVATINILNSIVYANSEGPLVPTGTLLAASCNISQQAAAGGQFIGVLTNPQFTFTSRGNFRLASTSPAVDACADGQADDLDGFLRLDGSYDQGALERDGVPTAVGMKEQGAGSREQKAGLLLAVIGLVGMTVGFGRNSAILSKRNP